jgi:RNA polymerase sigma-70 factor (ECF subfamily)
MLTNPRAAGRRSLGDRVERNGRDFESLLAGARRGDGDSITAIYQQHQPTLLRVLRAEVGEAADDVASQAWLEAMRMLGRFEGDERGFRALLFTIGRRRVADHRRLQGRRPSVPLAPADIEAVLDGTAPVETDAIANLRSDDAVRFITATLGPDQAEIVLLRVVAGLSVEEVASVVGRSPGAVRVQQHRALRRLATLLTKDDVDVL